MTRRFIAFNDSDFRLHDEAAFNAGWDALLSEIRPLVDELRTIDDIDASGPDEKLWPHSSAVLNLRRLVREGE